MADAAKALRDALDKVEAARVCIRQNRGYDRELAKDGYEHAVAWVLVPALVQAIDECSADLPDRAVVALAKSWLKTIEKAGGG